jgi:hypothetical protein
MRITYKLKRREYHLFLCHRVIDTMAAWLFMSPSVSDKDYALICDRSREVAKQNGEEVQSAQNGETNTRH